ncbi:NADPH-dependent 2,4-dienoyl-CoA reductase/sulfur reductase-like enzyme [Kibdelosporangium banguiense]|uniref:NADPH-dependent 2,4-dienoyl-CoA reductase/sulfur reductase-like enzyme n=1 Tax=Kibdelosporangium banguiense TaxID=1365924 RepID=A0ABS4T736_9PSEU|nr:FAD/NAD(P)-binding oxidoreductase [Kibdelosporangium banguiense]MBP2320232.1 NADPH-dependent 2,4-dienoyl-CoA reductase/sulfur reductase-like enzyme [Kibdelosporangium banguiense]
MTVVVVGAGPAGISAARAAASRGAHVVLVDAGPSVGGQFYRQPFDQPRTVPGVEHLPSTVVWAIEGRRVHLLSGPADGPGRRARTVDADALVLATGAYDRTVPFPGWDKRGVYTAGAAQILAKEQRLAIGRRVLVSGTGPFLFAVTKSLLDVGAEVVGVLEANSPARWLRHAFAGRSKLFEAARYMALLARHRIPYMTRMAVVAAHGTDHVHEATVGRLDADWNVVATKRIQADAVCVGYGFTPQLELAVAAGCELADGFVKVDIAQRTSVPGIFAAGEVTGIGGADLAAAEGMVAGIVAAGGEAPPEVLRRVRQGRRFAAALADAHPIRPGWQGWLSGETTICRCERVTYAAMQDAIVSRGATGARAVKLVSRVGLGRCQGRTCLRNAADLTGVTFTDRRPIAAPLRLGELAAEEEE